MNLLQLKEELLTRLRPKLLGGRELHRPQLRLVFVGAGLGDKEGGLAAANEDASEDVLPVMVDAESVPNGAFNEETYFQVRFQAGEKDWNTIVKVLTLIYTKNC